MQIDFCHHIFWRFNVENHVFANSDDRPQLGRFLLNFSGKKRFRHVHRFLRIMNFEINHFSQPRFQRNPICNLNFQTRSRVQLQNFDARFCHDEINAQISDFCGTLNFRRGMQNFIPKWNLKSDRRLAVWQSFQKPRMVRRTNRFAGSEINSHPVRAEFHVRFSVRFVRRNAEHRHHRHGIENNHSNVAQSRLRQTKQIRVRLETFFENHRITNARNRIFSIENIDAVPKKIVRRKSRPARRVPKIFALLGDDQNSTASKPVIWFEHKRIRQRRKKFLRQFCVSAHHVKKFGNTDPARFEESFCKNFIVSKFFVRVRIVPRNVV